MAATESSTSAALIVQTRGRNRSVASAKPPIAPLGSAEATAVTAYAVPEVPIDTAISPGSRPRPRAAPMLSPVPADTAAPRAVSPTASAGRASRGSRTWWPSASAATSGSQALSAGEKYPVPDASPRSLTGSSESCGPAVSSQVRKSCGSITRFTWAALSGSCPASQRSLVTVNEAFGTLPVRSAHHRDPRSLTNSAAAAADRRSFQSSAGRITSAFSSRTTMPCCCPATPTAAARSSRSSPARASASRQACGGHSVPPGCGALAWSTMVPSAASHSSTLVDCVEESTPATSMRPPPRWDGSTLQGQAPCRSAEDAVPDQDQRRPRGGGQHPGAGAPGVEEPAQPGGSGETGCGAPGERQARDQVAAGQVPGRGERAERDGVP